MDIDVLGNRQNRGFGKCADQQLQKFANVGFPARSQAVEPWRPQIQEAQIRTAAHNHRGMLQRCIDICAGADTKERKWRVVGPTKFRAMILKPVQCCTMTHSSEKLINSAVERLWRFFPAERLKGWIKLPKRRMRQMSFARVTRF